MDIFKELNSVFCKVFNDDDIVITPDTTSNDIDGWDSLSNMNLIIAIEKYFGIRFKPSETMVWKNVGQMYEATKKAFEEK